MSIKDLFDKKKTKPVVRKNKTDIATQAESLDTANQKRKKEDRFIPQLDFSKPENFAFYGSAEKYYSDAFKTIAGTYPYDGSEEEIIEFRNGMNYVERYIFDNLYPKTNGYALLSADGWGAVDNTTGEYGLPTVKEYIYVYGGPLSASSGMTQYKLKYSFSASNLYQPDIYDVIDENPAGRAGTRESNLKCELDRGNTVEFWLQKDAFDVTKTKKEVVFDLWNQTAYTAAGYGRLLVELSGNNDYTDGSPFFISVNSGSAGFNNTKIGTSITTASLSSWHHYAFSFQNDRTAGNIKVKFYVDGALNDEKAIASPLNEITGGLRAYIGSLQAPIIGGTGLDGAGKLSGSIDEFRYWKARRTSEDIGYNYFRPIRGGTNKRVSNATLGLYYKFNEGITTTSSTDSSVLDYSGRIANGEWYGYGTNSRSTGSAIVLGGGYDSEEKDPIIYSNNVLVSNLRAELEATGSWYDTENTNKMLDLFPAWMHDRAFETSDPTLKNMTQMMGVEFDKTFLLINRITELKKQNYFNDDQKAFPFIKQMLESYGLETEDLLTAAEINEKILNNNDTQILENDIQDVKNKLYQNLFNNLFFIYKSKGNEKAFRNIFRSIGLDDDLIAIKIYADNTTYNLEDNYKNKLLRSVHVDNNVVDHLGGTMYQWYTGSNANSISYITGSGDKGLEDFLGFTAECKFILPHKTVATDPNYFKTPFSGSSIFGMNSADSSDQTDLSYPANNYANFNVLAEKLDTHSTTARFRISSSAPFPIPELTTSYYNKIYSNTQWSIAVSVKPTNEIGNIAPGSAETSSASTAPDYNYMVEFYGVNMLGERVLNEFYLTSAIDNSTALNFLRDPKRLYMGSHYTNYTGTLVNRSDIKFDSLKYWNLHNDTASVKQHMIDQESYGRANSLEQINLYAAGTLDTYIPKFKTLILNWNFNNLSASETDGTFFIEDYSSGSADDETYGKYKGYFNKQHTGIGRFYRTGSTTVFDKVYLNSMQKQTPETTMASNMINILQRDDEKYEKDDKAVRYSLHFEKSPYESINKEILNMFSTILDFNNAIGSSVERYRQEYKSLENLRRIMFARFENEVNVEKFISYYRWFDHAVGKILEEFIPGSVKYEASLATLIQSHVLERNKYWTKFPTMEFKGTDPEAGMAGYEELNYDWKHGHAPETNKQAYGSLWWKERASRERGLLSSSIAGVNVDKEKIRMEAETFQSSSGVILAQSSSLPAGLIPKYHGKETALRRFTKPYKFSMDIHKVIHGGVNFNRNKSYEYTFNALYPGGPIHTPTGAIVPQNVLIAFENEAYDKPDIKDVFDPNKKEKVFGKVIHGRNYGDGTGYGNTDMNYAFPFNVYRSTVSGGYGDLVNDGYATGTIITNLHSDTYGPDLEVPMQGPFTEKWVGGLQARHIDINRSSSFGNFKRLDDYSSRPEAWRILLDRCPIHLTGAIGMAGADYPWPTSIADIEALKFGSTHKPYPMTSSGKAHFYRDEHAKRPVNIRNIRTVTGAISHGNYRHNYEVVHSVGSNQNPRAFLRDTPVLPFQISPGRNATTLVTHNDTSTPSEGDSVTLSDGVVTKTLIYKTTATSPDHVTIGYTTGSINSDRSLRYLASNINLSHSWGLRAYRADSGGTDFYLTNVDYRGNFTNFSGSYSGWAAFRMQPMSGSPNIAKTGDITNVLTIRNIYRGQYGHMYTTGATRYEKPHMVTSDTEEWFAISRYDYDYSVGYLTGSGDYTNKTIIKSRFAAPGGIETDTAGYRDFRGDEYSAYSPVPYRNLRVIRPDQATHDIVPDTTGTLAAEQGGPGIRVFDQSGRDIGIVSNLARHTARFGRDSLVFPPTQYRQGYSLARSFIGYGGEAIYRGNKSLQGWWKLDDYNMGGALTGNIDSSPYDRSYPFDSVDNAPSAELFISPEIFSPVPKLKNYTGPSFFVQTGSFLLSPVTFGVGAAYPIGPASLWESAIGYAGSQRFTLAAWISRARLAGESSTSYPRIFDFGASDVALKHAQIAGKDLLQFQYYSTYDGGGGEWRLAQTATGSLASSETGNSSDEWIHVAVSADLSGTDLNATASTRQNGVDGPRVKFYINGQKVDTFSAETGSADSRGRYYGIVSQDCYIGDRSAFDRPWAGLLADAAVWDQVLPEEDIVAIYNAAKKPAPQPQYLQSGSSFTQRQYGLSGPSIAGHGPGALNCEVPSLHKVHRNSLTRVSQLPNREVVTQQINSAWWPDVYAYENAGDAGITNNSSSINLAQWAVNSDTKRKMVFSFWIKDMIRDNQEESRNIFSLNTSLTGTQAGAGFSNTNAQAKQVFSVQLEESNTAPRRLAFTFGDGSNATAKTSYRTWFTENQVISKSAWTHVLVATDGYVSGAIISSAGTANFNWQENPLCGVCVWVNGNRQILRRNNYSGNVYGTMVDKMDTAGGGYFNIGGGMYQHKGGNTWTMRPNNMYIDELAMWQGTSTGSLVSSSIPSELYNAGVTHNLKKTTLGDPYFYYKFGDDPADPQTGSMTSTSVIHDQSTNKRHARVTIDGQSAGRMIMISASVPGQGQLRTITQTEVFTTRKEYDNFYIQHQIPRSDAQYAWITASFDGSPSASIKVGYAPFNTWDDGLDNSGNSPYSDLLTASLVGEYYSSNNKVLTHFTNVYSIKTFAPAQIAAVQNFGLVDSPTRRPMTPAFPGTNPRKQLDVNDIRISAGELISINTVGPGRTLKETNDLDSLSFSEHDNEIIIPFASTSSHSSEFTHGGSAAAVGREEGAVNPQELTFRTGPNAPVLLNPDADRFNLYLTKLNGPYGAANFTFIRNQENKNLQASRQYNFYTTIKAPSDSLEGSGSIYSRRSDKIKWYNKVSPVTSKYKTLVYGIGTSRTITNKYNQEVEIEGVSYFRSSHGNEKSYFNNSRLNTFLGLDKRENSTFYDKFKDMYLDGGLESELSPIQKVEFLRYEETIYPSSLNMYSRFVRKRPNFDMENWRATYHDRTKTPNWAAMPLPRYQFRTGTYKEEVFMPVNTSATNKTASVSGSLTRTSKWPLDCALQYAHTRSSLDYYDRYDMPFSYLRISYTQTASAWVNNISDWTTAWKGNKSSIDHTPAGRLLNNHTHWHGGRTTYADPYYALWEPTQHGYSPVTGSEWSEEFATQQTYFYADQFITASCLYALKNVSFHSNSVYAYNRPNVCFYMTASEDDRYGAGQSKMPNLGGDMTSSYPTIPAMYTRRTAFKYIGLGDAPFLANLQAGFYLTNTGTMVNEFVSASMMPFYDSYEAFNHEIRTKNKDMSVLPEFRIGQHIETFSKTDSVLDTTLPGMFEIPGAHTTHTSPDGTPLDSRSSSGSFFQIYSNSDFLEHFDVIKDDHKDLMEPTTLTLRCSAIKKFMPYKGFYPAERTVQLFDQFMKSYGPKITGSTTFPRDNDGAMAYMWPLTLGDNTPGATNSLLARPVITPLFAPGILFNSIKSGLGVDFPVLTMGGAISPSASQGDKWRGFGNRGVNQEGRTTAPAYQTFRMRMSSNPSVTNQSKAYHCEFGHRGRQNGSLTANRITASLMVGRAYADLSGSLDYFTGASGGTSHDRSNDPSYTLHDRYMSIIGSNRPGTLTWSKRIPFEAIIRPEEHMANLELADMFVNDHTALWPTGKFVRSNTKDLSSSVPSAKLTEPIDEIYTLMADNFVGAVPDFYLEAGELATITSKKQSELDLFIESGSCYAARLRMRRSMNRARDYTKDLDEIYHRTGSFDWVARSLATGRSRTLQCEAGDASKNYIRELDQKRQVADYQPFQDPIRQRGLYETLTMYNRPGAFGPPVHGRESDCFAGVTWGNNISFSSKTSSKGTNAVLDSSNGFNPGFTPPYYDGHAVVDLVFKATETKTYTIAEIMRKSREQSWRFDPGWLTRHVYRPSSSRKGYLAGTASFTLIPGEIYYHEAQGATGTPAHGVTGTVGPGYNVVSGSTSIISDNYDVLAKNSLRYGGAPYCGNHINFTSMQLDHCINIKLLGSIPATTTDNEGNVTIRNIESENDKVWVVQPKWETPVLNFAEVVPYPLSVTGTTYPGLQGNLDPNTGIGNMLENRSFYSTVTDTRKTDMRPCKVASTGMWHQFGKLPASNEGIYLEMIDIPNNWLDGHWSVKKNLNPGRGFGWDADDLRERATNDTEVYAWGGYNSAYTASAYDEIYKETEVKSLKNLLGFKSSAESNSLTLAGPGLGPKVRIGELAEKKIVSEAVIAVPFIQKGRHKYFFEIDKYFIDIARAERSPPMGIPDAGDSIKDMVEKMERYVLPPSMDFITYPEITPFSMYIFEFTHEFSKQDLANMWQNIAPTSARSFEMAETKIRHDLNQDELMGFALAKSDETFMKEVRWMVFKVKQKNMASYEDKIAGKKPPKISFKLASPMQIMPRFSKFKLRRVRLQNNSMKIKTSQITPTFRFGRSLTEDKTDSDLSFNWPYDYFSIIECAKIKASVTLSKPDDIEVATPTLIGPATTPAAVSNKTQAQTVKASTATKAPKAGKTIVGKSLQKVSIGKKSNLSSGQIKGLTFLKK